jgi:predicted Rossmann fold nucleotide-binding protein DprA/Smf involved in DNA uptake
VNKALNALTKKVEKMIAAAEKSEKPKAPKPKPAQKTVPKTAKKESAPDIVLGIVKRSKKGVNFNTLKKKTGFNDKKISNVVYRLKKQGKIKAGDKGVYVKA